MRVSRRPDSGYNLIEVIIAMALLSTVLLAISGLFVMGQKNIYSGKQMTRANSVGTRVIEDLSSLNTTNLQSSFGLGTATLGSVTRYGETYPNSVLFTTDNTTTDPGGYLTRWKSLLGQEEFNDGRVAILFTPRNAGANSTVANANIFRIRVFVEWNEALRERHVILETVKVDRTRD